MPDIFISYATVDNLPNPVITHDVTAVVDHFLAVYRYERGISDAELLTEHFFFDSKSISTGQVITEQIRLGIAECSVMLAFTSPNYFRSLECLAEWKEFRAADVRAREAGGAKLLIPIEVRPVKPAELERIDLQMDEWVADLTAPAGRLTVVTSRILLDKKNTQPLSAAVAKVADAIQAHLDQQRGTSKDRRSASNLLAVTAPIPLATLNTTTILDEVRQKSPFLRYHKRDPVCVIYAGGTVGMVHRADSDPIHADYEMAPGIDAIVRYLSPALSGLPFDMHFFTLATAIDSSNVTAQDWVNLANLVQEQMHNYQGFVILHGTNTLAYTASALSFLLSATISKPVVLTGSEVPLSVLNTDAIHNVVNAIRATAHQAYGGPILVPEVCVYWDNFLYRGNRVTKKIASDRSESFHTPNMAVPLAKLSNDKLDVDYAHILPAPPAAGDPSRVPEPVVALRDLNVAILFIHPDMDFADVDKQYSGELDGLILLSYGPGNAPEAPPFIAMLERLIANGTIVANVTQCPFGRVELKLFETSATLFDLGVVDGYDMTLEAAYTKLLWAIARRGKDSRQLPGVQESIKRTFQRNIAGEMSASIFNASFGGHDAFTRHGETEYLVSDAQDFNQMVDRYDIAEVFMRLEGLRFPDGALKATVRVYFGRPPLLAGDEAADGNLLAEFDRTISPEQAGLPVDKNFEVTHSFRKCFGNDEFQVSVGLQNMPGIEFSSLRLVLYTKRVRGR